MTIRHFFFSFLVIMLSLGFGHTAKAWETASGVQLNLSAPQPNQTVGNTFNVSLTYDASQAAVSHSFNAICFIPYLDYPSFPTASPSGNNTFVSWSVDFTNAVYGISPSWFCQNVNASKTGSLSFSANSIPSGSHTLGFGIILANTGASAGRYCGLVSGFCLEIYTWGGALQDTVPIPFTTSSSPPLKPVVSLYGNGTLATSNGNVWIDVPQDGSFTLRANGTNDPTTCEFFRGDDTPAGSFSFVWGAPSIYNCSQYQTATTVTPTDFGMEVNKYYILAVNMSNAAGQGSSYPIVIHVIPAGISTQPPIADIYDYNTDLSYGPTSSVTITQGDGTALYGRGINIDQSAGANGIDNYEWREGSCATGNLISSFVSFYKSDFSVGVHQIFLRVKDWNSKWSTNCPSRTITVSGSAAPTVMLQFQ